MPGDEVREALKLALSTVWAPGFKVVGVRDEGAFLALMFHWRQDPQTYCLRVPIESSISEDEFADVIHFEVAERLAGGIVESASRTPGAGCIVLNDPEWSALFRE